MVARFSVPERGQERVAMTAMARGFLGESAVARARAAQLRELGLAVGDRRERYAALLARSRAYVEASRSITALLLSTKLETA